MKFFINWLITATAIFVACQLIPGLGAADYTAIAIAALVMGLVNSLVKPLVLILTIPITVFTLGLFYFVINGAMLYLTAAVTPGFEVAGWWAAILGALVVSIVATLLHVMIKSD